MVSKSCGSKGMIKSKHSYPLQTSIHLRFSLFINRKAKCLSKGRAVVKENAAYAIGCWV